MVTNFLRTRAQLWAPGECPTITPELATDVTAPLATSTQSPPREGSRWLIVVAMVLTGLTMRAAVTSVGSALTEIQAGLHISSSGAGILTTLPVLAFAGMGSVAPRLAHRFGEHRLVAVAVFAAAVGLFARAVASSLWAFALLSFLALAGGAIANVLMPALVKRHFPHQIGRMTAVYTTALATGMTAAAGLTVPIIHGTHSWRVGIGFWAILSAIAVVPWLPTLRADRPDPSNVPDRVRIGRLMHSRIAWALTVMFGFQSLQAYIALGWFSDFFRHMGVSATRAGLLVAFYAALSIPVSMAIPTLAVRGQRPLIAMMSAMTAVAYLGMLVAPVGGAWLWMLFGGIGSGIFPLSLTMIGLRSRAIPTTAALSAFTQSAGYVIAGAGPLLVGKVLDLTNNNWSIVFWLLLGALAVCTLAGWYAGQSRFVDDELTAA
jgi:CP family cyanate transporter-like MFS transporter